ncbi:MAG TPA: hypothetical protein VEY91_05120 [Candidatus Limnocylindria bacterium]|nr:hypothetical protein [Candidatus Limnocylindria bacterium]
MDAYTLSHLSDHTLLCDLAALVARDRATTAALLAHIAEVDARRLYLPAAYPSMHAYCVHELRLSEDAAYKRIQAARTARQFPTIFAALAEGRLHLSAVCLLSPYLTPENADQLLTAAAHQTKSELEQLLAQRFPRSELLAMVQAIPAAQPMPDEPLAPVGESTGETPERAGAFTAQLAPGQVEAAAPRPKVAPIGLQRFALQLTIGQSTYDKLRYAQELLSHQIPSGDVAEVLDRALDALIQKLEQRKFAATARPRPTQGRATAGKRHIPAEVKRTVWKRDGGQCTFVSDTGHRCPARTFLEFDHIDEVARGGQATAARMRLRCRAHNQYAAECTFGTGFMSRKRDEARRAAAERRARAAAVAQARAAIERAKEKDVVPWLRQLGFRADQARHAAKLCERIPDASLEERVRVALSFFYPRQGHGGAANSMAT